jgi:hypothetical protein
MTTGNRAQGEQRGDIHHVRIKMGDMPQSERVILTGENAFISPAWRHCRRHHTSVWQIVWPLTCSGS